jgi:hypothetical protein
MKLLLEVSCKTFEGCSIVGNFFASVESRERRFEEATKMPQGANWIV